MSYYRIDTRNLTFAELWRIAKVGFPIVALLKIFRISLPMRVAHRPSNARGTYG